MWAIVDVEGWAVAVAAAAVVTEVAAELDCNSSDDWTKDCVCVDWFVAWKKNCFVLDEVEATSNRI